MTKIFFFLSCVLLASPALATPYYTGTGFIVSRQGDAVTNAHVLEGCVETTVRTTDGAFHPARITTRDAKHDLALLATPLKPERPARLRHPYTEVNLREKVMVMGYPEAAVRDGKYRIAYSTVTDLKGIQGESEWLQFEEALHLGNSGGPLMDYAGNVVGVVTGKATLTRHNALAARDEVIHSADFAINLITLRGFLDENRVDYESRDSLLKMSTDGLERLGQGFIVNVFCRVGE